MKFYKYQGTGNDFVMLDNRTNWIDKTDKNFISKLCNRQFGIGADGLILLESDVETDFKMVYFNRNGIQSSMCGNGGRCIVAFAKYLKILGDKATFKAIDGLHYAQIDKNNIVSLQMKDINNLIIDVKNIFVNSGSPHHILEVEDLVNFNVKENGSRIRYSKSYGDEGANVNFVKQLSLNEFQIRTYERGVEDETLSCGTGAIAVAIGMHAIQKTNSKHIYVSVEGGKLEVYFENNDKNYTNIFLKGATKLVFEGCFFE